MPTNSYQSGKPRIFQQPLLEISHTLCCWQYMYTQARYEATVGCTCLLTCTLCIFVYFTLETPIVRTAPLCTEKQVGTKKSNLTVLLALCSWMGMWIITSTMWCCVVPYHTMLERAVPCCRVRSMRHDEWLQSAFVHFGSRGRFVRSLATHIANS